MSPQEFSELKRGDIVRHVSNGSSYVIERSDSKDSHVAIRSVVISNAREWELYKPESPKPREFTLHFCSAEDSAKMWVVNPTSFDCPNRERIHVREVLP